jgi:hypothetical protein
VAAAPLARLGAEEDPARESMLHIARLHYEGGGDWYSNPSSMPNWMRGFQERTGIATVHDEVPVRPNDDALFDYPIAYMNGHGNVSFSEDDVQALRRWLQAGGFLWADDNYGMDKSFRREGAEALPERDDERAAERSPHLPQLLSAAGAAEDPRARRQAAAAVRHHRQRPARGHLQLSKATSATGSRIPKCTRIRPRNASKRCAWRSTF